MNFVQESLAKLVLELAGKTLTPELVQSLKDKGLAKSEEAAKATETMLDDWLVMIAREIAENDSLMHQLHVAIIARLWDMADDTETGVDDAMVKIVARALEVDADEYRPAKKPATA
jgi:hypothetical protein